MRYISESSHNFQLLHATSSLHKQFVYASIHPSGSSFISLHVVWYNFERDCDQTLVGFVNFKLYHALGLNYPPVIDERLEKATAGVEELMEVVNSEGTIEEQEDEETIRCKTLFKDFKIFLAREVPLSLTSL